MYMYQEIKEINVTSYYFANGNTNKSFPRRIETSDGRQINFIEEGLRCVVKKGQDLVQVFNMNDGQTLYRVCFEPANNTWRLLGTRML